MSIPALPEGFEILETSETEVSTPKLPAGFELLDQSSEEETGLESSLRQIARTGARATESILGIPGDVQQLLKDIPASVMLSMGADPERVEKSRKFADLISPVKFGTSGALKEMFESVSKGYLTPKTAGEKFSDDVTEFVAPLMLPVKGAGALKKGKNLLSTLFKGTAATSIGKAIEGATDSEIAGRSGQIGSYIVMSMLNPKGMTKYINGLYESADKALPKKGSKFSMIKTGPYKERLSEFKSELETSLSPSDAQKSIINRVDKLLQTVPAEVHPERILETKKSINTDIAKLQRTASDRAERKLLNSYTKKLSGLTKETLRQYGKRNPRFIKALEAADEAYATKAQSDLAARFIEKTLKGKNIPFLAKAIPYLVGGGSALLKSTVGQLGVPLYYMGRFAYRYGKSPTLRKYYNQILKGAVNGNATLVRKSAEKLEKELEKESNL